MNHTTLIFIVFSFLVGILVFAIWSNTRVFAQQLPSLSSSAPPAGNRSDSSSSASNPISPQLKAKICDPSNPSLKVVNTTESRICGIPKTIKPSLLSSAATPPISSAVSSSSPSPSPQTTITTTKPTTLATNAATSTPKQQQQIAATNKNNNINASSRSTTNSAAGATIAPVSNAGNKSSSSTSLQASSAIAPQVKAINQQQKQPLTRINGTTTGINSSAPQVKAVNEQQQQPPAPSPITLINGTDRQNYTFVAAPPKLPSGELLYLGYHDGDRSNPTNGGSGPNDKDNHDAKPSIGHSSSTTSDNGSIEKEKEKNSSGAKLNRADGTNDEGSSSKVKGSSFDAKPSSPPYIKITAPDNDASSKKSNEKTTSSAKSDRTDNTSDDDAKSFLDLITGSATDSGSIEKKTSSAKSDRDDSTKDDSSQKEKSRSDTKLPTPHIRSGTTTNDNIIPKDKSAPDTKPSNPLPHIRINAPDNDSIEKEKEKTSSAKLNRDESTKDASSFKKDKSSSFDSRSSRHTNDGTDSSSSSDLASTFRNKPDSIIINSPDEVRHNLFGFSDHGF